MRDAFLEALLDIAAADKRVVLLTGDLGFTVLEPFAERFPDRFYNVGVAEQNMVGMATGLAESGLRPYVYSIATFATMRPYEFIRNGPVLHELPVRIVGIGAGFDYGHNGISHYALEDVAIMRAQPGLTVVAPADPAQARTAARATSELERPIYYRIGKGGEALTGLGGRFRLGRAECLGGGDDVAIVAMGSMAVPAAHAAAQLAQRGLGATVAVVSSFGPAPREDLAELLADIPLALTAEAAYIDGGVGSLVAEIIAEEGLGCRLVRCGVREMPRGLTGSPAWLHRHHGLDPESLANAALTALRLTGP